MEKNTDNMKKVVSATDTIEAGIFVALLKNNGIPAYTVDKESGDYLKVYMGYTVYGVDIYVNELDWEQSAALLSELALPKEITEQESELPEDEEESEFTNSILLLERHTAARMIVAIFIVVPTLLWVLSFLISYLPYHIQNFFFLR